jgi:farnesyl-diphosphate farnesyltransferase
MAEIVARTNARNNLQLRDVADLQRYCYIVAGIVGEMLTELFLLGASAVSSVAGELRARAVTFGEALQLVNILRDADDDADEGRCYLPREVPRAEIFALARHDLEVAGEYVRLLQDHGAPRGTVAFTALPARLAWATLARVEEVGPGSKLSRGEVAEIVQSLHAALDRDQPAIGS